MPVILNGAPSTIMKGILDLSPRQVARQPEERPTHLPLCFFFAPEGPTSRQIVGSQFTTLYGADALDKRKKYVTHATPFIERFLAAGNVIMAQRLKPSDAAPPANIRIFADVIGKEIPDYQRNSDGTLKRDVNGAPIPKVGNPTVPGYEVLFTAAPIALGVDGEDLFGQGTSGPGVLTDGENTSTKYPLMDLEVSSFGEHGNNKGVVIYAPTLNSNDPVEQRVIQDYKAYPVRLAFVKRPNALTSAKNIETLTGEQEVEFVLKPNVIDLERDAQLSYDKVVLQAYSDNTPGFTPTFGPFGRLHVYQTFLTTILDNIAEAEAIASGSETWSDVVGDADETYRVNLFGALHSSGAEYATLKINTSNVAALRFTPNSIVYASGGTDGTMNATTFATLVSEQMQNYANPNHEWMDMAVNTESVIYDSGFPLATKKDLAKFIQYRKNTFVHLSTHTYGLPALNAAEESSMGASLRSYLQAFPESETYGTGVCRAMVCQRSGVLINDPYTERLPVLIEIADKAAKYMGAGNGIWKPNESFSSYPGNALTLLKDINVTFTPAQVKNKDWAAGMVWVDRYARDECYFPALRTVYEDDTSILTSYFNTLICMECETIGALAQRNVSGTDDLTDLEVAKKVRAFITDRLVGRFNGRVQFDVEVYYVDGDRERGYSWTTRINVYGNNMKTVQSLTIAARRLEDLQ